MKVLLLGAGLQGRAALHDLNENPMVADIRAADLDVDALRSFVSDRGWEEKTRVERIDASDPASLDALLEYRPRVIVDLLPVPLHENVTRAAIKHGIHVVNTSYASSEILKLDEEARANDLAVLPELGMDPGIDLVLMGEAIRRLDAVEEIRSYGAGFPESKAARNPIRYKETWNFEGVLKSYHRPARVIRDGTPIEIPAKDLFLPENVHCIEIDGLGELEAFPNGDAEKYASLLGDKGSCLTSLGRYVLRWPGHAAFWKAMADLHLLDDEPIKLDGMPIDRKRFLSAAIRPHIQYNNDERDVVVVRIDAKGIRNNEPHRVTFQLVDHRNLETGFTAMSRTVGYTAALGALMLAEGTITGRGVLSPLIDVPYDAFKSELDKRGILIKEET